MVYFSAEKRVDYRPLQRDLGRRYRLVYRTTSSGEVDLVVVGSHGIGEHRVDAVLRGGDDLLGGLLGVFLGALLCLGILAPFSTANFASSARQIPLRIMGNVVRERNHSTSFHVSEASSIHVNAWPIPAPLWPMTSPCSLDGNRFTAASPGGR